MIILPNLDNMIFFWHIIEPFQVHIEIQHHWICFQCSCCQNTESLAITFGTLSVSNLKKKELCVNWQNTRFSAAEINPVRSFTPFGKNKTHRQILLNSPCSTSFSPDCRQKVRLQVKNKSGWKEKNWHHFSDSKFVQNKHCDFRNVAKCNIIVFIQLSQKKRYCQSQKCNISQMFFSLFF